jgi:hypothetical protein
MEQKESLGIGVVEEAEVKEENLESVVAPSLCINVSESMVTDTLMV